MLGWGLVSLRGDDLEGIPLLLGLGCLFGAMALWRSDWNRDPLLLEAFEDYLRIERTGRESLHQWHRVEKVEMGEDGTRIVLRGYGVLFLPGLEGATFGTLVESMAAKARVEREKESLS
jgi:hypothetical protein